METVFAKNNKINKKQSISRHNPKNQTVGPKKTTHSSNYLSHKLPNNGATFFHNPSLSTTPQFPYPHQYHHPYQQRHHQQNPPLLPLPINVPIIAIPRKASLPCGTRNLTATFPPRKPLGEPRKEAKPKSEDECCLVLSPRYHDVDVLFSLESPPPTSLPLPRFSRRSTPSSKLSCNAEAVGNSDSNNDATYNLRKMLRLI